MIVCVLIQFRGRSILFDCGIHPGKNGQDSFPLLDDIWDVKLDCVLITHFHSDHCAALPYLITRTGPDEVAAQGFHDPVNAGAVRVRDKDTSSVR